ncbi:uncharacterized protein G2W53_007175 [Senna tora]|uniref:Uncharacterized protein n=1 Tax=Senna tora TaxID=362788 RepID=A0A834X753_9FABA|nr:uncharacterized protein G2W53_007175 [Senna tora]
MSASAGSLCTTPQVSCERARIQCNCGECAVVTCKDAPTCQCGCEVGQKVQEKITKLEDEIKVLTLNETHLQRECESRRKVEVMLLDYLKKSNKREPIVIRVLIVSWVLLIVILAWLLGQGHRYEFMLNEKEVYFVHELMDSSIFSMVKMIK